MRIRLLPKVVWNAKTSCEEDIQRQQAQLKLSSRSLGLRNWYSREGLLFLFVRLVPRKMPQAKLSVE